MPTILRNNATNIELDFSANFKVSINKGDFDVVLTDPGNGSVALVVITPRSAAVTDNKFTLDWRDISDPLGITSATQLRDLILSWNSQSIIVSASALPAGAATEAKQDTLLTELQLKADKTDTQPVEDQTIYLLRRIVKLLESNAVVDVAGRQRVVLDSLPGAAVSASVPVSGSVTATVASTTITGISGLEAGNDPRYKYMDAARLMYGACIRQNLAFT
jgi:hypothetical protein